MDDATKQKAAESAIALLDDLRTALESGARFVVEQAPPLAKEILNYGLWANTITLVVTVPVTAYCLWWFMTRLDAYKKENRYMDLPAKPIFLGLGGVVSSIVSLACLWDIGKILLAPRLFILEYAASIIHGGCGK